MEATLQEQLLEQFHELVLACAVTAGSTGRGQQAMAAASEAAGRLRPILAVLPGAGAAGTACLGRACAALQAKKRLKGKAVAAGLQAIIQSPGGTNIFSTLGVLASAMLDVPDMHAELGIGCTLSHNPGSVLNEMTPLACCQ